MTPPKTAHQVSNRAANVVERATNETAGSASILFAILFCLALIAWAVNGDSGDSRAVVAQGNPTLVPTIMPTFEPWTPAAPWMVQHAVDADPLWTATRGGTPPALNAVHGVVLPGGGHEVWAVGDACSVAVHRGEGWQRVTAFEEMCAGLKRYDLRDVFVRGPGDLWAVGRYEGGSGLERDCVAATPISRDDVDYDEGCGMVVRHDGTGWSVFTFNDVGLARPLAPLNALDMLWDAGQELWFGWIAGNDTDTDSLKSLILEFLDDGRGPNGDGRWRYTATTRSTNISADLRAAKIISAEEAWIVGENGHEAWYKAAGDQPGDWGARGKSGKDHLYAMDMTDAQYGWDGGQKGRMNRYLGFCHDDDPETACWFDNKDRPIRPPSGPPLTVDVLGIDLLRRGVGWVVGGPTSGSSTIAYLQPDEHWYTVPIQGDPRVALNDVWMAHDGLGFAVGDEGTIIELRADGMPPTATGTATLPVATSTSTATTGSPIASGTPDSPASPTPSGVGTATAEATPTPPGGSPPPGPTASASPTSSPPDGTAATPTDTPAPGPTSSPSAEPSPTSLREPSTPTQIAMPSSLPPPTPTVDRGVGTRTIYLPFAYRRR